MQHFSFAKHTTFVRKASRSLDCGALQDSTFEELRPTMVHIHVVGNK